MYRFTLRININGTPQDIPFVAESLNRAQQQAAAQFGSNSVLGCINEERI